MKYKLKKDLPFAKAGEEVLSNEPPAKRIKDDTIKRFIRVATNNIYGLTEFDIPTDTFYDWIEEVKPRELYVEFFRDTNKISDSSFDLTYLRNDARFYTKRFIEVIE